MSLALLIVALALALRPLRPPPEPRAVAFHWGYQDGEIPSYEVCPWGCGMTLRSDRADLIDEHYSLHHAADDVSPMRSRGRRRARV